MSDAISELEGCPFEAEGGAALLAEFRERCEAFLAMPDELFQEAVRGQMRDDPDNLDRIERAMVAAAEYSRIRADRFDAAHRRIVAAMKEAR